MGRFLDGHQLLIGIEEVEIFHAGRARFFVEKEKRGRFGGKDGHGGESPGCGYQGLLYEGAVRCAERGDNG